MPTGSPIIARGSASAADRPESFLNRAASMVRLSLRKKLAFALAANLAILAILEGSARIYLWARSGRAVEEAVIDRHHPLRYDLAPGRSMPSNGAEARIDNFGLRGRDVEVPKTKTRVLCLGDSATFGYAPDVTDDSTYPAWLARDLDRDAPGKFEVLNGGRPSFSSVDCLAFFSYRASEFRPDVVVIMVGWNDTHLAHPLERPASSSWSSPAEYSDFLKLLGIATRRIFGDRKPVVASIARIRADLKRRPRPTDRVSDDVFARDGRVLEDLAALCQARGAKPILVKLASPVRPGWSNVDSLTDREVELMAPHLIGGELSPGGWLRFVTRANEEIDEVGRRLGIPVVSTDSVNDPSLFVDVCHPTAEGNARLAALVEPAVLAATGPHSSN